MHLLLTLEYGARLLRALDLLVPREVVRHLQRPLWSLATSSAPLIVGGSRYPNCCTSSSANCAPTVVENTIRMASTAVPASAASVKRAATSTALVGSAVVASAMGADDLRIIHCLPVFLPQTLRK